MKVSVIICSYNQESTIRQSIDSVLAQNAGFPYEIILADDASSDTTPDICREYASRYPDIIRLKLNSVNRGLLSNYYDALEMCRGEYISDLAGDDYWPDPEKLVLQVAVMDSDPDITLVHAGWLDLLPDMTLHAPSGYYVPDRKEIRSGREVIDSLMRHRKDEFFVNLSTGMYRKDTAIDLTHRFPALFSGEWPCEDFQLVTLLALRGKIASMPQIMLHYRRGISSISSEENPEKNVRFASSVMKLTRLVASVTDIPGTQLRDYYRRNLRYIIAMAFRSRNADTAAIARDMVALFNDIDPGLTARIRLSLMRLCNIFSC